MQLEEKTAETLYNFRMLRDQIARDRPTRLPTAEAALTLVEDCAELVFFGAFGQRERAIFVEKMCMANDLVDALGAPIQ